MTPQHAPIFALRCAILARHFPSDPVYQPHAKKLVKALAYSCPLLPLLIDTLCFSLSQAGFLGGAFVFSSSLLQPVYGSLEDRHIKRAFVAALILSVGLERSYLAAIPGLAVCGLLIWACPRGMSSVKSRLQHPSEPEIHTRWKPIVMLSLLVIIRSSVQFGISQFLPLYFTQQGYSTRDASLLVTLYLLADGLSPYATILYIWLSWMYSMVL